MRRQQESLLHHTHTANITRIHEDIPKRRIDRHPAVIRSALLAGEDNAVLRRTVGSIESEAVNPPDLFNQLLTEFFMLRLALE